MPSRYGDPVESFGTNDGEQWLVAAKHDAGVRISVGTRDCMTDEIMIIDLPPQDVQRLGAALTNMGKILYAEQAMRWATPELH